MAILRVISALLLAVTLAAAQETKSVRISFLPPPLDGTISLGVYDSSGRLVRVLEREAELEDFEIGQDSLSTTWDGKNDREEPLPPGKYHARGYAVATADVDGVGYSFNDWVTDDDSLRIMKISSLAIEDGLPVLSVKVPGDTVSTAMLDASGKVAATGTGELHAEKCRAEAEPPQIVDPISCDSGKEGTRWIIDRVTPGSPQTEVEQFSREKDLLRRLSIPPNEPQPREIAASKDADTIFLLEETGPTQRLRSLTLTPQVKDKDHSDWKVDYEKSIVAHKNFTIEKGKPVIDGGKAPNEKITVKLMANPLKKEARENLDLVVGFDEDGSFLKAADGLPLVSISDTKYLTRIVLSPRGENSIDVFQDDDAVVEQFRIDELDKIMSFDCGEIELK
ncbi:MAG: hypothetical protein M3R10_05345 [Verrucomicrobiota bacterium]|nr:hypothetical protein [Verrucomicrobiota bacterium]